MINKVIGWLESAIGKKVAMAVGIVAAILLINHFIGGKVSIDTTRLERLDSIAKQRQLEIDILRMDTMLLRDRLEKLRVRIKLDSIAKLKTKNNEQLKEDSVYIYSLSDSLLRRDLLTGYPGWFVEY